MSRGSLLLVRHGESTWNAVRRWQGRADPPLSERGELQAAQASSAAATLGSFDHVVTSTLQRARRTGQLLARSLEIPFGGVDDDLAERSAGEWEGLTRAEIEERYPGFLAGGRRPPGYEPDHDVVGRVTRALLRVVSASTARHPRGASAGSLLVVTHGGVINALERRADEPWRRLDNLEGRWFDVDPTTSQVVPVGERVHLLGWGAAVSPADGPGYA